MTAFVPVSRARHGRAADWADCEVSSLGVQGSRATTLIAELGIDPPA